MQIIHYLVFPGFLFAAVLGLLTAWLDRKVTARVQYRVGPPWYQSFADVFKLMGKEVVIPENAKRTGFLLAPMVSLAASALVATMLGVYNFGLYDGFVGDIIVFWYFLAIPSIMLILGAGASGSPLASVGSSREMKLLLGYEVPFIIVITMVIFKVGATLSLTEIIEHQIAHGPVLYSVSGVIGFIVALLCVQAKLGLVPFDMPEAETELGGGVYYDYSGAALGAFKLSKAILLYALPVFLITLFWGGIQTAGLGILWAVLKYALIVVLITLIRNTNPRLRIDQAVRFFWGKLTLLAIIAFILSVLGI